jgi:hypothetical protein
MNLRTYLFENNIKYTKFAKTLGISYSHLYGIIMRTRFPSQFLASRIQSHTDSKVLINEIIKKKSPKCKTALHEKS